MVTFSFSRTATKFAFKMISDFFARLAADVLLRIYEAERARRALEERIAIRAARARADEKARAKFRER